MSDVIDIIENSALSYLRKQLRTQMNDLADDISGGAMQDFAAYREACGVIKGLAMAERELLDLVERMNNQNT